MKFPINPGGALSPDHVIGRDQLIADYWEMLSVQSLALLAPRRIGKTHICRRMVAKPPPKTVARWRDLEGLDSAQKFVKVLFDDCEDLVGKGFRVGHRARRLLRALTGAEVKGFKVNLPPEEWVAVLDAILADLAEAMEESGQTLVLFWDEFTWFLSDLIEKDRAAEATVLIDRLRAARQSHPRLRMIFTGSIGLGFVLARLRAAGYGNEPFNDVNKQTVPLLDDAGAQALAERLVDALGVEGEAAQSLARELAQVTEGHPLLMHAVAQHLKFTGSRQVAPAMKALLDAADDPLELGHFLRRLRSHLPEDRLIAVHTLLDALAPHAEGLTVAEAAACIPDREAFIEAVEVLRRDQYVLRQAGRLRFRLEFLRRYWCLERMLS